LHQANVYALHEQTFVLFCVFFFLIFRDFLDKIPFCIIHIKCYGKKQLHLV